MSNYGGFSPTSEDATVSRKLDSNLARAQAALEDPVARALLDECSEAGIPRRAFMQVLGISGTGAVAALLASHRAAVAEVGGGRTSTQTPRDPRYYKILSEVLKDFGSSTTGTLTEEAHDLLIDCFNATIRRALDRNQSWARDGAFVKRHVRRVARYAEFYAEHRAPVERPIPPLRIEKDDLDQAYKCVIYRANQACVAVIEGQEADAGPWCDGAIRALTGDPCPPK